MKRARVLFLAGSALIVTVVIVSVVVATLYIRLNTTEITQMMESTLKRHTGSSSVVITELKVSPFLNWSADEIIIRAGQEGVPILVASSVTGHIRPLDLLRLRVSMKIEISEAQVQWQDQLNLLNLPKSNGHSNFTVANPVQGVVSSMGFDLKINRGRLTISAKGRSCSSQFSYRGGFNLPLDQLTIEEMSLFGGDVEGDVKWTNNATEFQGQFSDLELAEALACHWEDPGFRGEVSGEVKLTTSNGVLLGEGSLKLNQVHWEGLRSLKSGLSIGQLLPGLNLNAEEISNAHIAKGHANFKRKNEITKLDNMRLQLSQGRADLQGEAEVGSQSMSFRGELLMDMNDWPPHFPKNLRSADGRLKLPIQANRKFNSSTTVWKFLVPESTKGTIQKEAKRIIDELKGQVQDKQIKEFLDKAPEALDNLLKGIKF